MKGWYTVDELSYQQQLVYDGRELALNKIGEANDHLDNKAKTLLTAASLVTGIVAGAKFLPEAWGSKIGSFASKTLVPDLLLVAVLGMFLLLIWQAIQVWNPKDAPAPGPNDPQDLYDDYIALTVDEAFNHALIDITGCIADAQDTNAEKSGSLQRMGTFFQIQIGLLMVALAWPLVSQLI